MSGTSSLFDSLPLRDNYKVMHEDYVRLKGPPTLVRACFIIEILVAAAAFALFFTYTITSTTTETTITYETLGSSYVCTVLSPRSDAKYLSDTSSELMQFSSARFMLDECLDILGTDGLDVCSDDHREDYVLSVQGLAANDANCFDMLLDGDFRFCYGSETNIPLRTDLEKVFPRQTLGAPSLTYENTFYFMKENGVVYQATAPFSKDDVSTIFLNVGSDVYVASKSNEDKKFYIWRFSASETSATALTEVTGGSIRGIAVSDEYAYVMTASNDKASVTAYKFADSTTHTFNVDCDTSSLADNTVYQLLAAGDDGYLYVMCSTTVDSPYYTFYKVAPDTFIPSPLYADIGSLTEMKAEDDDNSTNNNPFIKQVETFVVIGDAAYFSTQDSTFNLIRVDLTPQPTNAPTTMPTPQGSPSPTIAPTALSPAPTAALPPPPGPLAVSLGDVVSMASAAYRRILVSALTSAILHVSGLNDTETAASLHRAVAERTQSGLISSRSAEEREDESTYYSHRRRLASVPLQPVENLGPHIGDSLLKTFDDLIYFQNGNYTYYNTSAAEFGNFKKQEFYYKATAVQLGYVFAICDGVVVSNVTISTGTTTAFYDACDDING